MSPRFESRGELPVRSGRVGCMVFMKIIQNIHIFFNEFELLFLTLVTFEEFYNFASLILLLEVQKSIFLFFVSNASQVRLASSPIARFDFDHANRLKVNKIIKICSDIK